MLEVLDTEGPKPNPILLLAYLCSDFVPAEDVSLATCVAEDLIAAAKDVLFAIT
jgi:hypothetical protein